MSSNAELFTIDMMNNMLSEQTSASDKRWIMEENFKFPLHHAATLLFNHSTQDWRDVITKIKLPSLIVGGEDSVVPLIARNGFIAKSLIRCWRSFRAKKEDTISQF